MSAVPTDADRAEIVDLVQRSQLRGIEFHEVSVRRLEVNKQSEESTESVEISLTVQHRRDSDSFGVLFSCTALPYKGEISVAVAAEYDMTDGETPGERTVKAFANEVAVMTLFPYVREAVSTGSVRVFGKPVTLPVLERGQVAFDLDEDASE
ncbi:hypothetical protein GCM10022240_29720 [Microbacterium kribbense]|uniref:Preprotein translocase subunit SecB n=1 Tax=Microbacterium kribbense TaxID=433645 RepID=A0ABP7GX68_9MICO